MGKERLRSIGLVTWCCLLGFLAAACSVQAPKRLSETAANHKTTTHVLKKPSRVEPSIKQKVVSMDYLRPVSAISHPVIYIYKEKRRLYVLDRDVLVRDYPIGLGKYPKGDKEKRGDGRTPEGNFYVCVKNPVSRYHKALGLSYPDLDHADRALITKLITPQEYRNISLAMHHRARPPWHTPLGGEIFIHGGGAQSDWTDGCIALYNSDIDELYKITKIGTPVIIKP